MTPLEKLVGTKATKLAKQHLELKDFIVKPPSNPGGYERETVSEFCDRCRISWMTFKRRILDTECPAFRLKSGTTGRTHWLISNEALDAFMTEKRPGDQKHRRWRRHR